MDFRTFFYELFLERFETPNNFLLDPANKDKLLPDLEAEFIQEGGKILGSGVAGKCYAHPKWKYILKTFAFDRCYLRFLRFAQLHPRSAFPIVYGKPYRIIPQYRRHWGHDKLYAVRLEKLLELKDFKGASDKFAKFDKIRELIEYKYGQPIDNEVEQMIGDDDNLRELVYGFNSLFFSSKTRSDCRIDLHDGNVMVRPSTGQLVITDPMYSSNAHPSNYSAKKADEGRSFPNSVTNPDNYTPQRAKKLIDDYTVSGGKLHTRRHKNLQQYWKI